MKINKVYIFGMGGSGKTVFGSGLSKKTGLKMYELDNIVIRKKDYTRVKEKIRDNKLNKILKNKKWIIEGVYTKKWVKPIIKKADAIIFLKTNMLLANKRLMFRFIKRKFVKNGKKEGLKDFLWLLKSNNKSRLERKISEMKSLAKRYNKKIVVLKNKNQLNKFLKEAK